MYKDDLEALRARLTTVEAELLAERQHRAAAVAKMQAALAAADEERVKARQAGQDSPGGGGPVYWRNWRTHVLIGSVVGLALAFGYFLLADRGVRELEVAQSGDVSRQLELARKEIAELKNLSNSQSLELRSLASRCRPRDPDPRVPQNVTVVDPPPTDDVTGSDRPPGAVNVATLNQAQQLLNSAQAAYVAGNHRRAVQMCKQVLKLQPDHYKAVQILGAASCYLKNRGDAQWAYERVARTYQPLLRKVCLNNGVALKN